MLKRYISRDISDGETAENVPVPVCTALSFHPEEDDLTEKSRCMPVARLRNSKILANRSDSVPSV